MRTFTCDSCGLLAFFDNERCARCGAILRFDPQRRIVRVRQDGERDCVNQPHGCNWLVADGEDLCESCLMTRTVPSIDEPDIAARWADAEAAKRRLLYQMGRLGLDVSHVRFDLLSSRHEPITTGHADGLITLDLAEADDVVLARMRAQMDEAYRTLLGHFRHEIGHALWQRYVHDSRHLNSFREVFGDERDDYGEALERHYDAGPPDGWRYTHVSAYATAHPWEDVAETIAHHLHMTDVLEAATWTGVRVEGGPQGLESDPADVDEAGDAFHEVLREWTPLATALNEVNRAMGHNDLYPFVLPEPVIAKLGWVHDLFREVAGASLGG